MREALSRINSILTNSRGSCRILVPQQLIDDAFPTDELADAWFKAQGLRLTPVRLQGRPGLACIYRNGQTLQHLKRKRKPGDIARIAGHCPPMFTSTSTISRTFQRLLD